MPSDSADEPRVTAFAPGDDPSATRGKQGPRRKGRKASTWRTVGKWTGSILAMVILIGGALQTPLGHTFERKFGDSLTSSAQSRPLPSTWAATGTTAPAAIQTPAPTLTPAERQQILENNASTIAFAQRVMRIGIDHSLDSDKAFTDTRQNNATIPDGTIVYTDDRGSIVSTSQAFYVIIENAEACGTLIDPTTGQLMYAVVATKDSTGKSVILLLHPDLQANETIDIGVQQRTTEETGSFGDNPDINGATFAKIMGSAQTVGTAVNLTFDASTATWIGSNPNNSDTHVNYIRQLVRDGNQAAVRAAFQQLVSGDTTVNASIVTTLQRLDILANNPTAFQGIGPVSVHLTSDAAYVPLS